MARGFSTTFGVATTDKIVSSLAAHSTLRSYAIWFYFHSGTNNRIWCKQISGGTQLEQFVTDSGGATHSYNRLWSGGANAWTVPTPAAFTDVWHHWVLTYDGGDVNNDPLIYLDGVSQTVTQIAGPTSGTISTNTDAYHIGNRGAGDRVANGMCAEFAVWDRILTPQEVGLIYSGLSPDHFPLKLVEYLPLNGSSLKSKVVGRLPAVATGTKVTAHPKRIIGPTRSSHYYFTAAAAYTLDAAAGSYAITGQGTDLFAARILNAAPGTYAVSGLDSLLVSQRILNAATGSYVITGADALLIADRMLAAGAGSYLITGADALLVAARVLDAAPGSYVLTGADAILLYTPIGDFDLLAEPGVYAITGADALNLATRIINVEPGAYAVSGADAQEIATRTLDAEPGSYAVSGADAILLYTSLTPPATGGLREKRKWRRGSA